MAIKLQDTLSKSKKELVPRSNATIEIFVCGPTVYDYSHIGHARTYIAFDAFVKYLRYRGYQVRYVQNITDLDDKIIARAEELEQAPEDLARNFEAEYYHDMEKLGIDSIDKYARATDYIPQIISQAERLMDKGYAYLLEGDGIYYDISRFSMYGKLSGRTVEGAEDAVSRIDESVNKRNKGDFALWKSSKPDEPSWPSPWGLGRPGWHIEDTAITESEFGARYDIHGGARDLIFPHHESEIAQMEAISGKKPLVNYWMHTGFLTVNGEKMSKSLGNFITIREFFKKFSRETFRLFILASHYRSPIDYSERAAAQAAANAKRLGQFYNRLKTFHTSLRRGKGEGVHKDVSKSLPSLKDFWAHLDDDFNTPKALALVFELVRETNSKISENKLSADEADQITHFLADMNKVFGIIPKAHSAETPQQVLDLVQEREKARADKDWEKADKIRAKVTNLGYVVKDTPSGPELSSVGRN